MDISITGSVTGDFGLDKTIAELKKIDGKTIEAGLFDGMNEKKAIWNDILTSKTAYEKQYHVFRKLLKASYKEIALSEIIDCIDEITICQNKNITVKWAIAQ